MHATTFGDSRSRSTSTSSGDSSSFSGGGGITGVSGAGASGVGGVTRSPLAINEISYDKCLENMARIIISSDI